MRREHEIHAQHNSRKTAVGQPSCFESSSCRKLTCFQSPPAMSWYKLPSTYAQKMSRLSCKIFGEYYTPPPPKALMTTSDPRNYVVFMGPHKQNGSEIIKNSRLPFDIDPGKNFNYYPPHPQIRELMFVLRQHGLYRDEHLDFNNEMKRLRLLRGKTYRIKGGGGGKRSKLKE